uniref:Uncharacterized protein n=2 Tax=Cuerna arida TaxID=1464854 RepID=A0A1B6H493_9HEMI
MCERTKDDFKTVYQRTFTRKIGFRPDKAVYIPDYKDILAGPFTEYVVPDSATQPEHPFENVHHCCERLLTEQPKMKRYLDKEPSPEAIASDHSNRGRTVYMVDYCDLEGGFESAVSRARRRVDLPPNWGEIPVTTQKASYRSPSLLATWDLRPRPCLPRISPLTPNLKEREILKVTTGVSEYEGRIGTLGELILQDELHGTPQDVQCLRFQEMMKIRGGK